MRFSANEDSYSGFKPVMGVMFSSPYGHKKGHPFLGHKKF